MSINSTISTSINRRRFLQLTGGSVTALALSACAPVGPSAPSAESAAQSNTTQTGGILRVAFPGNTNQLDPMMDNGYEELNLSRALYDCLVDTDHQMALQPGLALAWEATDDGLNWTFTLREGVTFQHGTPFTAQDVVYSFERILAPDSPSPGGSTLNFVETVEALDDYAVRFVLNSPSADLPFWLTSQLYSIVPHDRSGEDLVTTPSGTGPFRLVEFLAGERITMARNETYWRDQGPYVDELHFVYMPEIATQVSALVSGEIDIIWQVGFETIAELGGNPAVQVLETISGGFQPIVMRVNDEPFTDPRIRQAIKHCVDREGMRQVVLQGRGELGNDQPVPPANPFWADVPPYGYDIEQAKALLAEAGYPDGIELTLYTSPSRPGMVEAAVVLQEMAKPAGITIQIEQVPASNYWSEVWRKVPFCVSNWSMGATADQTLSMMLHSSSAFNGSDFRDPRIDAAIEAARGEVDPAKRQVHYAEVQRIVAEEGGLIIPYFRPTLSATRSTVQGFQPTPLLDMDFRSAQLVQA